MVGIIVDQLRTDYIEYLQNSFGEKGFRTLLTDGVYMRDVDFKADGLDAVSSTAMLLTGAYPSATGVPGASVYMNDGKGFAQRIPLVKGSQTLINNDSFTPEGLRLSTVADELVIDSKGASAVYSIAADPQTAVIMAGHAGKGAYWINNSSGNWATTSYYGSIPSAVGNRNFRKPLAQRIDTMQWRKYRFSRQDRDVYKKFAASPLANAEITDVAIDIIDGLNLGSAAGRTDMLNVAYSLAPYRYSNESSAREEIEDAYLRLDRQIGRLIEAADRKAGAENTLIWLVSTGYYNEALPVEEKYRIPGGDFSTKRARSLLNSYLSAKFGSAEYVKAIRGSKVYFDQSALENNRIDSESVIREARSFLVKMDGVAEAFTFDEVLSPTNEQLESIRLATDPRSAAEIYIRFSPGWKIAYDEELLVQTDYIRESPVMTPAFLLAPGIKGRTVDHAVNAVSLAPALSGILHIRPPNGARSRGAF